MRYSNNHTHLRTFVHRKRGGLMLKNPLDSEAKRNEKHMSLTKDI